MMPYKYLTFFGRDDWIRTSDLCVPNAALYQAEPRPDRTSTDIYQKNLRLSRFLNSDSPTARFLSGCSVGRSPGQPLPWADTIAFAFEVPRR